VKNNNNVELLELKDLALEYCRQRGLVVDVSRRQRDKRIEFVIQNGADNEGIGVIIKDWKRAVGVDIIIRTEQILIENRWLSKILIVSNFFSDPARALADKIGIFLLTRNDLIRILSSDLDDSKPVEKVSDNKQDLVLY
jgi:hypothetical protein